MSIGACSTAAIFATRWWEERKRSANFESRFAEGNHFIHGLSLGVVLIRADS